MYPKSIEWDADTEFPVDLATIKAQLRIDHDELDVVIMGLHLPAAVEWAEGEMHRSILAKQHRWILTDFPRHGDQSIRLPRGKTQSVTSIAYTSNNSVTTLTGPSSGSPAGTDYREDLRGNQGGLVYPAYSEDWPTVDADAASPVVITFTAGWERANVPPDIKGAIINYVADSLDIVSIADMPSALYAGATQSRTAALTGWRLIRWY